MSDRQTSDVHHRLMPPPYMGGGIIIHETSCVEDCHNMPCPLQVDFWPFDFESVVPVTCDVGYLCASFSLPRPLCSRLKPDVRDRQTDVRRQTHVRQHHRLMPPLRGRGHNNTVLFSRVSMQCMQSTILFWQFRPSVCLSVCLSVQRRKCV